MIPLPYGGLAMKIFVCGMTGAGNLGDDLIAFALHGSLRSAFPSARLAALDFDVETDLTRQIFSDTIAVRGLQAPLRDGLPDRRSVRLAGGADLFVLGGGGLLQDSHFRYTPYSFLRWAFLGGRPMRVSAGLGVGPIRAARNYRSIWWALRQFDLLQVRDARSQRTLALMGLESSVSGDVVAAGPLPMQPSERMPHPTVDEAGFSFRPWPGLSLESACRAVHLALSEGLAPTLYVFENSPHNRDELDFALAVKRSCKGEPRILCYGRDATAEILDSMSRATIGVASRFHANLLWGMFGVPVLSISYAPKVRSLNGLSVTPTEFTDLASQAATWALLIGHARTLSPEPWRLHCDWPDPATGVPSMSKYGCAPQIAWHLHNGNLMTIERIARRTLSLRRDVG